MGYCRICPHVVALVLTASAANAQDSSGVTLRWRDHPSIEAGAMRLELAARVESDMRLATPSIGRDAAELRWQSPRVELRGRLTRRVEFEVSRDFGRDAMWKDAYVNVRLARLLEIEAGRFKIPFGRETLTGRANLDFIHRSLGASQLAPSRDAGVMVHGRVLGRRLSYQAGYFDRDGDNARTSQAFGARHTVAVRVVSEPFRADADSAYGRLQLAIALAGSRVDRRLGLRGRTLLEDGVFFERMYVNGRRLRLGLEAFWTAGPASLGAEYMRVTDERNGMGFRGDDLPAAGAHAWYVAGTWALTGERKDGWPEPRRAITRGGTGAVELVARIEELHFASASHPGTAFDFPSLESLNSNADRVFTAGVNWYLTRHVRVQYNFAIEWVADPNRSPAPTAGGRFGTAIVRLQLRV